MKKKVIAVMLATVLCLSTSLTALATNTSPGAGSNSGTTSGGSSSSSSSSASDSTDEAASEISADYLYGAVGSTGVSTSSRIFSVRNEAEISTYADAVADTVTVNVMDANNAVLTTNLTSYIKSVVTAIVEATKVTSTVGEQALSAKTISGIMTSATTDIFKVTVDEVAANPQKELAVYVDGTVANYMYVDDPFGYGKQINVGQVAGLVAANNSIPIMLMGVYDDGSVEIVQGVINIDNTVSGLFKGLPKAVSVLTITYWDLTTTSTTSVTNAQ
jgi:hypothetical protein